VLSLHNDPESKWLTAIELFVGSKKLFMTFLRLL